MRTRVFSPVAGQVRLCGPSPRSSCDGLGHGRSPTEFSHHPSSNMLRKSFSIPESNAVEMAVGKSEPSIMPFFAALPQVLGSMCLTCLASAMLGTCCHWDGGGAGWSSQVAFTVPETVTSFPSSGSVPVAWTCPIHGIKRAGQTVLAHIYLLGCTSQTGESAVSSSVCAAFPRHKPPHRRLPEVRCRDLWKQQRWRCRLCRLICPCPRWRLGG